jgi:signal transduction histidine kinase
MQGAAHRRSGGAWTILFRDDSARAIVERRLESAASLRRTVDIAVEMLAANDDLEQTTCELLALIGDELHLPGIGWFEVDAESRCRRIASWSPGRSPAMTMPTTLPDHTTARLDAGQSILERGRGTDRLMVPITIHESFDSILVADFESDGERKDEIALVFGRFCEAIGRRFEHEEMKRERESFAKIRSSLERSEATLQLAGGFRHDFNNAAFAIKGRISLLLQRTDDVVVTAGLEEIREAVDGSKHLIDRFVPDDAAVERPIQIPIRTELAEIVNTVKRLIPRRLDLTFECDDREIDDGLVLEAAPEALQRILLDLVVNSRDAIRARGRIRISARRLDADRIEIRVDDDGPGIPQADRERFLEPFESGRSSTGLGVGLSRCHRSADRMGGRFELTSSPLGGLGARLLLPVSARSPHRRDERPAKTNDDARMPRVTLVVEDDAMVRDVIKAHLEQAGTGVIDAGDATGVEARLAADHHIEMLVMDIDLPRRSGIHCISALRAAGDRTPCVLITGGAADPPPLERTRLLRKPFEMEPLISTIRDLLADCESDPAAGGRGG